MLWDPGLGFNLCPIPGQRPSEFFLQSALSNPDRKRRRACSALIFVERCECSVLQETGLEVRFCRRPFYSKKTILQQNDLFPSFRLKKLVIHVKL